MSVHGLSDRYDFIKKEIGSSLSDSCFFFNTKTFLGSRDYQGKLICFEIAKKGQTLARMWTNLIEDRGYSPWRAPFGSIECCDKINVRILNQFISEIKLSLLAEGIKTLDVVHYPNFYDVINAGIIEECFLSNGFKAKPADTNQHIDVYIQDFASRISYAQRKRLNKCKKADFKDNIEGKESVKDAHELLTESRNRKGYPITMSYPELMRMFELHPEHYFLFTIRDQGVMIAMAICIRVSENIIYNFYHADHEDYGMYSPTVMLVDSVYKYCQAKGIDFIDLGISSVDGELNEGLYNFKKGLGAIESFKKKYTWPNPQV